MQRKKSTQQKRGANGPGKRIGIAVADFNADITDKLLSGARSALQESGVRPTDIQVVHVAGSFELPFACQSLARTKRFDGLIALGCVIKGETDHYYYIAGESARGLMRVGLTEHIPIGLGVLTVETLAQAKARTTKNNNIGAFTARAVLQTLSALQTHHK